MNLYRISSGYRTKDFAVIAAASHRDAKKFISLLARGMKLPKDISIVLIGVATYGTPAGLVVAAFNVR